ncbi:MAG: ArnT family glycosyltransferase [Planctomycetaceae bacterium]
MQDSEIENRPCAGALPPADQPGIPPRRAWWQVDFSDRRSVAQCVWLLVGLGVTARVVRHALGFPLWSDEYLLAANFLDRSFSDLLAPLDFNQVAPVGFLWVELACVRLLGFSEWSLRLFPCVCGVAALFVFRRFAGRLLKGPALVLAVALVSVAYYPIRYSAEVKPYATDLLASLVVLDLLAAWWQQPEKVHRLWLLAAVAPLLMLMSFTTVFVAGAASFGIAWFLWAGRAWRRSPGHWSAWATFNVAVCAAFVGLLALNVSDQYSATRVKMVACWAKEFPPWRQPWELFVWLVRSHTSEMFAYPLGAENGGSVLTAGCFALGLWVLWHAGRREFSVVVAACFSLAFVAALLKRYPYGGHSRLVQYLAPLICVAAGAGAAHLVSLLPVAGRSRAARWLLAGCLVLGCAIIFRDGAHPWKSAIDRDHRAFALAFWSAEPERKTVCLLTDLGLKIYPDSAEPPYRCYQRLYSAAHRAGPRDGCQILASADRPLRCVVHHSASSIRDDQAFHDWLDAMRVHYDLESTASQQVALCARGHRDYDRQLLCYDVYRFAPRNPSAEPASQERLAEGSSPHIGR